MDANQVRKTFFDFFESKKHKIVPSAPMVVKDDPTLMFTNAGMNQFKNIFLGNSTPVSTRLADTQKCLRVSGKHNDLEEVGHDTYHHTMFEMLGNWSFGDYFKKEAIEWAWELLTEVYKIDKKKLYVTVFGGDEEDGTAADMEAFEFWKKIIPEDRILYGSKKDNFWEMGDTGPSGPCSEIHVDIRDEEEKKKVDGRDLVNMDHPEVIEIWNLVFIEFNRKADGNLEPLPAKHVDTGMGFERLSMVLQGVKSNYDTDIFQNIIQEIAKITNYKYGAALESDIAMRVIADHLRAVVFAIADGQLPSNMKAGYVIRRIFYQLVPALVKNMGDVFPEIKLQQDLIRKVITEEEIAFLRTLSLGIKKFELYLTSQKGKKEVDGVFAFELFDTYGFPVDLTQLMAKEKGWEVDMVGFQKGLEEQKNRSRNAAQKDTEDWVVLKPEIDSTDFLGYDQLESESQIVKYRKIKEKKKEFFQVVLDKTPFYAESGGQVGDKGLLISGDEKIGVTDTQKENDLTIHFVDTLPAGLDRMLLAVVDKNKRLYTVNNHTATHLMHAALRKVLGDHVEQKGSLVDENHLRFDFSHYSKLTDEEIHQIEKIVNEKIRENILIDERNNVPMDHALEMGAVALFGEKYGDQVRVITFDKAYSVELCGGTHVPATGQIGLFKIIAEGAIAAGIRRIEAITALKSEEYVDQQSAIVNNLKGIFKSQKDVVKGVETLIEQNNLLQKQVNQLNAEKANHLKSSLKEKVESINGVNFLAARVALDANTVRDLAFKLKNEIDDLFLVLGSDNQGKAGLTILISDSLVESKGFDAGKIIRDVAKEIQGGGGGQPHFATAGGKNPGGLDKAFAVAKSKI